MTLAKKEDIISQLYEQKVMHLNLVIEKQKKQIDKYRGKSDILDTIKDLLSIKKNDIK
eukprot:CAMPEP_0116902626 /NCGR_PEP_ID=MMETSP0467-20121206/10157_1 /TAXON_ID=283647 /ORGANISM="Mesodinium pulex, Strain SPMC105" /LENGTH=57 /DNA_ID=CAMNT_0004576559 /DNA_START=459 /DNA_END=632 /DNA_ORIENTATION=+